MTRLTCAADTLENCTPPNPIAETFNPLRPSSTVRMDAPFKCDYTGRAGESWERE